MITVDAGPGGAAVTAKVRYDEQGRAVESRKAGSTGADAGTSRAVYYTAGAHGDGRSAATRPPTPVCPA